MSAPAENMEGAEVIHRRRAHDHERADDERAFHVREGEAQVGLQASLRALVKLRDLEIFPPERVHHPDGAESFLRLGEERAVLFLDRGGFRADAMREKIDRADDERDDA